MANKKVKLLVTTPLWDGNLKLSQVANFHPSVYQTEGYFSIVYAAQSWSKVTLTEDCILSSFWGVLYILTKFTI